GGRRRGAHEARPAGCPELRDPRRRRLPPLLPRAPRARERATGVPARPLPRDRHGDRALPRSRRSRGAGADVRLRVVDGLLLTRRQRLRRYGEKTILTVRSSAVLAHAALALG